MPRQTDDQILERYLTEGTRPVTREQAEEAIRIASEYEYLGAKPELDEEEPEEEPEEGPIDSRISRIPNEPTTLERAEVKSALRAATRADTERTPGVTPAEARRRMDSIDNRMEFYPWGHAPTLPDPPSVERVRELLPEDPDDRPAGGPNLREVRTPSVRKIIEAIDSGASDEEVEKLIGEAPISAWPDEILMTRGLMQAWGRATGPRTIEMPRTGFQRTPEVRWAHKREKERYFREMLKDEGASTAMSVVWASNVTMSLEEAEKLKLYLPDAPQYDGWATAVSTLSGAGAGILSGSGVTRSLMSKIPGGTTSMSQAARFVGSKVLPRLIVAGAAAVEGGTAGAATGTPMGIAAGAIIGGAIGWASGKVYGEMTRGGEDFWKPVPAFGKAAQDDGWYFALPAGLVNLSTRAQIKLGFGTQNLIPLFLSGDDAERFRAEIARSRPTESFEQIVRELQTAKENGMSDEEIRTNLGPTLGGMVANNAWVDLPPEMRLGNLSTTKMIRWARLNPQAADDKSRPGLARIVDVINNDAYSDTTLLNALESVPLGQLPEAVWHKAIPPTESMADAVLIAAGLTIEAIETTGGGAAGSRGLEQTLGRLMLRTEIIDGQPKIVEGSVGQVMRVVGAATEFYAELPIPYITPAGRDFQRSGTTMIRSPDSTYLSRILANIETGEMGFARHMTDDALARGHERGSMQYDVLGALGLLLDWTVYWERPFIASVGIPTGIGVRAHRLSKDFTNAEWSLSERARMIAGGSSSWLFVKTLNPDALPVQAAINRLEDLIPGEKTLADVEAALARTAEGSLGGVERKVAQQVRDHMEGTGETYAEALNIVDKAMDADVPTVVRYLMETAVRNAIRRGDTDIWDLIPKKWHDSLRAVLKNSGQDDPTGLINEINLVSQKNGRLHLAGLERLMSEGDPGTQQLRTTPEYIRVKEGMQALVEAGDIEQHHAAWILGLMEQNAWRMAVDEDVTAIKTPVDWFRAIEVRRRGKPPEPPDDVGGGPGEPGVVPEPPRVEEPELPLPRVEEAEAPPVEEMPPASGLLAGEGGLTGIYKFDKGSWQPIKARPAPLSPDAPLFSSVPRKLEDRSRGRRRFAGDQTAWDRPGEALIPDMQALGWKIAQQPGRKDILQALGLDPKNPRRVRRLEAERVGEGRPVGLLWVDSDDFLGLRGGTLYGSLQELTKGIRASARNADEARIEIVYADVLEKAVTAQERKIILDDFGDRATRLWGQRNETAPSAMVTIMPGRASEIGSHTHLADDLYGLPTISKSIETEDGYTIVLAEPHPRWIKERVKAEAPPRVEEPEAPAVVEEPEAPTIEEVPTPKVKVKVSEPEDVPDKVRSVPVGQTLRERAMGVLKKDLSKMKKARLVKIIEDLVIIPYKDAAELKQHSRDELAGAVQRWAELYGRYPILTGKEAPGPVESGAANFQRRMAMSHIDQMSFDGHISTEGTAILHKVMDRLPSEWFERVDFRGIEDPDMLEDRRVFGKTRLKRAADSQLDDAALVQQLKAITTIQTRKATKLNPATAKRMAGKSGDELLLELSTMIDENLLRLADEKAFVNNAGFRLDDDTDFMKAATPYFVEIARRLFEDPDVKIRHGWSGMQEMLQDYARQGKIPASLVSVGFEGSILRSNSQIETILSSITNEFMGFHDKDVLVFHVLHELSHTLMKNILTDDELSAMRRAFDVHRKAGFKGWHRREDVAVVKQKSIEPVFNEWAADMLASNLLGHRGFDELMAAIEADEFGDVAHAAKGEVEVVDLEPGVGDLSRQELEAKIESLEDGRAIADWLSENADNPSYRTILKLISPHLDGVSARIYRGKRPSRPGTREEGIPPDILDESETATTRAVAKSVWTLPKTDKKTGEQVPVDPSKFKAVLWFRSASIKRHGISSEVIVHELLHGATQRRLIDARWMKNIENTALGKAYLELEGVRAYVRQEWTRTKVPGWDQSKIEYATSSVDELISFGLTNKGFQEILKGIRTKGNKTAFTRFVELIRDLLGIDAKETNALTDVIRLTEDILSADLEELTIRTATVRSFSQEVRTIFKNLFARIASVLKRTYGDEGIIKSLDIDKDVAEYFTDFVDRLMKGEVEVENIRRIYERRSNEPRMLFSISSSKRMRPLRDVSDVEPAKMTREELDQAVQDAGFIDLPDANRAMQDAYLSFEEYEHVYAVSRQGLGPEDIWDIPVSGKTAVRVNDLRKQWESLTDDIMTRRQEGRLDGIEEMEAEAGGLLDSLHAAVAELQTDRDGISSSGWVGTEESLFKIYQEFLNSREDPKARLQAVGHRRAEAMKDKPMSKKEYDSYFAERVRSIIKSSPAAPGGETVLPMPQLAKLQAKALLNRAKKSWEKRSEVKKKNPQAENFVDEHALSAWNLQRIRVNRLPAEVQAALELTVRDAGGPRTPKPEIPGESTPPKPFEILFHGPKGEERGFFSFDFETYQSLIDVLKYGNYQTLVRSNALLFSKFMGEKWTQGFIKHFENVKDDAGRVTLTERGERQAARAFEYYIRSATSPHGGLKRYFDQAYITLQDYWAKIRGQVSILPPEVRNFFDQFLRPDLRYEGDAIKLTENITREPPLVRLPETAAERLREEIQPRMAKRRAFWAVNTDPRVVRAELGIQEGQTQIDPVDLLVAAVGYVAAENAKKLLGPGRIFMMTPRSMVPESRRRAVLERLSAKLHASIGTNTPKWNKVTDDIPDSERPTLPTGRRWRTEKEAHLDFGGESGWHELDPAQQAGMKVLAQDLARHPMGNIVPDRFLVPDADLSTIFVDEWASIIEAVIDIEAGVGARRAHYSEAINPTQATALWMALKSGVVDLSDASNSVDGLVKNLRRMFKLEEFAGGKLGPLFRTVFEKNIRMMELAPREILALAKTALEGKKELSLQGIFLALKDTLRPPVDTSVVDDIVGTIDLSQIDRTMDHKSNGLLSLLREWTGAEKAHLYGEGTEKTSAFLRGEEQMGPGYHFAPTEEGMSKVEYIVSSHHQFERILAASNRYTDEQRINILQPLRRYAMDLEEARARGVDGADWVKGLTDADRIALGDVIGRLEMAMSSSYNRILEVGSWIAVAAGGERDASILVGMLDHEKAAFYKWFYDGKFREIFDYLLEYGRETGHVVHKFTSYQPNQALLNMIVRLRAYELMGNVSKDLARYGLLEDVTQLGKDLPLFDAATGAYTGFRIDSHVEMVQFYIQMELNYRATGFLYTKTVDVFDDAGKAVMGPDGKQKTRTSQTNRPPPAPTSKEGKSLLSPKRAEYAKSQGWKQDPRIPGNFHEMAAYTEAMEILDRAGVKVSTEGWERVTFHDGTEALMPAGAAREYYDALDRLSEIGTARAGAAPARAWMIGKKGRQALAERPTGVEVEQWNKVLAKGQLGKVIDDLMKIFPMTARHTRMGVTTGIFLPNPAYYFGVAIGAYFQLYEGLGPWGALRAVASNNEMTMALVARMYKEGKYKRYANPIVSKTGETLTVDLMEQEVHVHGMKSSYAYAETAQGVETLMHKTIRDARAGRFGKTMRKVFDQQRLIETSTAIDNYFRVSAYLDARVRGMSATKSAELARKTGFDYAALTEFEKKYMRSTILFYSYFRKNMDLFWDTLLTNPERIIGQLRLVRGIQQIALEDDPEVVLRSYAQTRLPVWFKKAAANTHVQNQWMYIVPPLPYDDAMMWPIDLFDALRGENEAIRSLVGHVAPWWQAPFVFAQEKDLFWGKELELYNRVPTWLVEWDLNMTGGMLVKDVFDVQLRAHADPNKADAPSMDRWYHARNGKAWWIWRNLLQFPTAGRSMDTISSLDRANIGPVEWMNAKTKELGRGWDPASAAKMRPSDFNEDTMSPRRGLEWYDELLGLIGIRPLVVEHGDIASKRKKQRHIAALRQATSRAELSDPYRYEGGILSYVGPGFKPPK